MSVKIKRLNIVAQPERRWQLTGKTFLRKNDEVSFGAICGISSIVILGTRHAWKTVLLK